MKSPALTEQVVVGVPLIFKGQSSIADMVEILQPLEIRHRHTASIQVHVLQDQTSQAQTAACLDLTSLSVKMTWSLFPLQLFTMQTIQVSSDSIHTQENLMVGTYRNNHDVVLQEDLVSIWGGWTVGTFSNDLKQTERTCYTRV